MTQHIAPYTAEEVQAGEQRLVDAILKKHPPVSTEHGLVLGEDEETLHVARKMLGRNWRLLMMYKRDYTADFEWCYGGYTALVLSYHTWNPKTQHEPMGWYKRAGLGVRTAPNPADSLINRHRCVHGSYPEDGPCKTEPRFCTGA